MTCNFQIGSNKTKLLTEYESVTQNVLLFIEPMLQNAKQLQHALLSWHVRCPSGFSFPPSVLQRSRCNCFYRSQQFWASVHRGRPQESCKHVLNVSPHEEVKRHNIGWARRPWNWSITSNPAPREMHVKKSSDNTSPVWGVHHLAGTPHLADDLPTGVTACSMSR
jgi:hypothetical protein